MRILWVSNAPWTGTGYGIQTGLLLPRLQALGHQVACLCFYGLEGSVFHWNGILCLPKWMHPFGQDMVGPHAERLPVDVVISLMDAWVCEPKMYSPVVRWCPLIPVDTEPVSPAVIEKVTQAWYPMVFTRFAERVCREAGVVCRYVPHGVDTKVFRPKDRASSCAAIGLPNDRFIAGMVAMNKGPLSRKAFPQCLEAFAEFRRRHPDVLLYLHTTRGSGGEYNGLNLPVLISTLGITDDVVFADPYVMALGFNEEYMVHLYNAMDVLLSPSLGEGFGVPIIEAQSCGRTVIAGDWTAMSELCFAGWRISRADASRFWLPSAAWHFVPRVGAIVEALEEAWRHARDREMERIARVGVQPFDIDLIMRDYWMPALEDMARRITEECRWSVVPGVDIGRTDLEPRDLLGIWSR
jgi:glycosyltransferase involved in cell wall biosynthesis